MIYILKIIVLAVLLTGYQALSMAQDKSNKKAIEGITEKITEQEGFKVTTYYRGIDPLWIKRIDELVLLRSSQIKMYMTLIFAQVFK